MSLKSRRELRDALALAYSASNKLGKNQLLDGFIQATGYNRKYAITLLGSAPKCSKIVALPRTRRRKYGPEVETPLVFIWGASGGICPKRLIPFLPTFIEALERHDELTLCHEIKEKLVKMSISTAERLLCNARRRLEHGICTTSPGLLLRHQIPIRTFEDWNDLVPGLMEIDLVAPLRRLRCGQLPLHSHHDRYLHRVDRMHRNH